MLPTRRFPMCLSGFYGYHYCQDYIAAVEKAWENAVPVKSGGKTLRAGPRRFPRQLQNSCSPGGHYDGRCFV